MCLVVFALDAHPLYSLVLAANRDEFQSRATAPLAFWLDATGLLAGRDLVAGGTWLGLTPAGRLAFLTNFRDPRNHDPEAPSRGALVRDYLLGTEAPEDYLRSVALSRVRYNSFNLVAGTIDGLISLGSRDGIPRPVPPGVHGLSNHVLDTPWPKVRRARAALDTLLSPGRPIEADALFELLSDRAPAPDDELPETGVGIELERLLSPPFIVAPGYGTRSSSVVIAARGGSVSFRERSFDERGLPTGEVAFELPGRREERR